MSEFNDNSAGSTGSRRVGRPFSKGDPNINRKGRPRITEMQREFRLRLHKMQPDVLKAARKLLRQRKPDPHTTSKLVDKLGGPDSINVRVQVDKELAEFLDVAKETLGDEAYERLASAFVEKTNGGG